MGGEQDEGKTAQIPAGAQAKAEAEYDATWDEAAKADGEGTAAKEPDDDGKVAAPPKQEPTGQEPPPEKDAPGKEGEEGAGDTKDLEKALTDTKEAFTRAKEENAELRRQIEAAKSGEGDPDALEKAKQAAASAQDRFDDLKKKLLDDYPELEGFMDETAKMIRGLRGEVEEIKKGRERDEQDGQRKAALETFNSKVRPVVVEEHKDFDEIMKDPNYWEWAEKQRPALQFAALDSPDPEDIKYAIREFKRFQASPEAQRLKKEQDKSKKERIGNAQSLRPGAPPLLPKGSGKKEDYDAGWDEAGRELEREGVRIR